MFVTTTSCFFCNRVSIERTILVYVELLGPTVISAVGIVASVLSYIKYQAVTSLRC